MLFYNRTAVSLPYDREGRMVDPFSFVETKMNPVVRELLDQGKVVTRQRPAGKVRSDLRQAGHSATQERDQR